MSRPDNGKALSVWMATVVLFLVDAAGVASDLGERYGVALDDTTFPQATPQETLASVLAAVEKKRADYVLARLTDPAWVDRRVRENGGRFGEVVREATARLVDDPGPARRLRRFLKEGDWQTTDDRATARLKDVNDRQVYLRLVDGRWFLENRYQAEPDGKQPTPAATERETSTPRK